jgi:hypothetical protein
MESIIIGYGAVLAAAVAGLMVGAIWYSDYFWGRQWRELMGVGENEWLAAKANKGGMFKLYLGGFILELLMAYVLAHLMVLFEAGTLGLSAQLSFWSWLGFVFPVMVGGMLWESRPWRLVTINLAHRLAAMLAITTVLFFLS